MLSLQKGEANWARTLTDIYSQCSVFPALPFLSKMQKFCRQQLMICSGDYDVTKGALSTIVSNYMELTAMHFIKNQREIKKYNKWY